MGGDAQSSAVEQASMYLAQLLKREPYRSRWNRPEWKTRTRDRDLHHAAIARVLANYLHEHPRESRKSDKNVEYTQLVPLVSKALSGKSLSAETLRVFAGAFKLRDEHIERLWRIHDGTGSIHAIAASPTVPTDTVIALNPGKHTTRYAYDHHYLGPDGRPYRHEALQVIEALADGTDRYAYAFDPGQVTVEVQVGGALGTPYTAPNGVHAIDILFDRLLSAGEIHAFKYETTFGYDFTPGSEFRRSSKMLIKYAEIKVIFHPTRLPKQIWEADWGKLGEAPHQLEPVALDSYYTVTRHLTDVQNHGFGYVWAWR
jgi:hypothetical protein